VITNPKPKIGAPTNVGHLKSLRPPQFGLRTLLLLVAVCGVLLAIVRLHWLSPVGLAVLLFLAASIFCHVAGNAIGTRLREIGDRQDLSDSRESAAAFRRPRPQDFAPATQLSQRQSLGWTIVIASSVGVTSGAVGGGLWTFVAGRGHIGLLNIAVGVIAFAVLGGIAAFATVGFAQVLAGAIWQAMHTSSALSPNDSLIDPKS
jgi:hypothetical protein